MDGFKHTLEAIPEGSTRRMYGTAYWDGSSWFANINGKLVGCRWMDPLQLMQGGNIVVDITNEGRGQNSALVLGGYADQPRPSTGTVKEVIPAGVSTTIVVHGEDGLEYQTDRFIGSYSPGDAVYLTWDATKPTIIGVIPALVPPPPAPPPPPPQVIQSGETTLTAVASDTWWAPGGWGSYASSRNGGEDVYTGTWSGQTVTGAWFYGAPRPELQGKTITRVRFHLPARMPVGSFAPATVHLYVHNSQYKPGGDVARIAGPYNVPIGYPYGGGDIELPVDAGPALAAGGGISIAGEPYAAFNSRLDDPTSGKLILNWRT